MTRKPSIQDIESTYSVQLPPNDFGGLRRNCETGLCELCRDVLASNDPILSTLPSLPEIEEDWRIAFTKVFPKIDKVVWLDPTAANNLKDGFMEGYKAASKKNVYSEANVRKALVMKNIGYGVEHIIKSLKPAPKAIECEMEDVTDYSYHTRIDVAREPHWKPKVDKDNKIIVKRWIYE